MLANPQGMSLTHAVGGSISAVLSDIYSIVTVGSQSTVTHQFTFSIENDFLYDKMLANLQGMLLVYAVGGAQKSFKPAGRAVRHAKVPHLSDNPACRKQITQVLNHEHPLM